MENSFIFNKFSLKQPTLDVPLTYSEFLYTCKGNVMTDLIL